MSCLRMWDSLTLVLLKLKSYGIQERQCFKCNQNNTVEALRKTENPKFTNKHIYSSHPQGMSWSLNGQHGVYFASAWNVVLGNSVFSEQPNLLYSFVLFFLYNCFLSFFILPLCDLVKRACCLSVFSVSPCSRLISVLIQHFNPWLWPLLPNTHLQCNALPCMTKTESSGWFSDILYCISAKDCLHCIVCLSAIIKWTHLT